MRETLRRLALLCSIVQRGSQEHGHVGHTLLQKLVYLLQLGRDVDVQYPYRMYYYGPYSAELWADVNHLEDLGLVNVRTEYAGNCHHIKVIQTDQTQLIARHLDPQLRAQVDRLVDLLKNKNVRDLECVATTAYVYRSLRRHNGKPPSDAALTEAVRSFKPHINQCDVRGSLDLLSEAHLLGDPQSQP